MTENPVREHKKIKLGFMEIEKKTLARLKKKRVTEVGYDIEDAWDGHFCTGKHYHRPKGVVISNTCLSCFYRDQTDCNLCSDGEFLSCMPIIKVGKSLSDEERAKLCEILKPTPWTCPSMGWLTEGEDAHINITGSAHLRIIISTLCILLACCILDDYGRIYPTILIIAYFIFILSTDWLKVIDERK